MTDIAGLRDYLLAGRNSDGGWGYSRGKASRLEPTCCAVLALGDPRIAREALASWPMRDGLLLERSGGEPNYGFHALALVAFVASGVEHSEGNASLVTALERSAGIRVGPSPVNRQKSQLQGWGWFAGEFSWAEPTAWAVLALKRARKTGDRVDGTRLLESEAVLFDRVCGLGGWNYGSSNMLGRELTPYVPTTAIALLALQDRHDRAAVQQSVAYLEQHATWETSSYALGLAAIALRSYGHDVTGMHVAIERQLRLTVDLGQQIGVAMALLALQEENAAKAFEL